MKPRGYLINGNFYDENISDSELDLVTPLYMEEPAWKRLTNEEVDLIADEVYESYGCSYLAGDLDVRDFAKAILRKAQEK